MRKLIATVSVLMLIASSVFAADFVPQPMVISAPATVAYDFDGAELSIPVDVAGAPATGMLLVYTKDKGATINAVHNGYLGWHYVNKIDTCVYVSVPGMMDIGANTLKWSGKDNDGNVVASGEYTYYIWGFDNFNFKIPVTRSISPKPWGRVTLKTHNDDGSPKAQPYMYQVSGQRGAQTELKLTNTLKWLIGSDPDNADMLETTGTMDIMDTGGMAFDPANETNFFKAGNANNGTYTTYAWEWVPNDLAVLRTEWGEDGISAITTAQPANGDFGPGVHSDGGDFLLTANSDLLGTTTEAEVVYLELETGEEVKRLDVAEWFVSVDDADHDGQSSSGPAQFNVKNGQMVLGSHSSCMNLVIDLAYEEDDQAIVWFNDNGDYTGDHNFEEGAAREWICNDYNVGPYKYNITLDDKGFSLFPSFDMGAVSFGLYAPDGTGLSYHALAGETANQKLDTNTLSYGSAYDGLLVSNNSAAEDKTGFFWVGQDTFMGTISSGVSVDEDAPAGFAVAQNSPNPFNPTTTIGFSIADAGNVSIDVFNVAGQKIDTVTNGFMAAGNHTVSWDASGFSAGVYFYTVTSGDMSKTMKMTLVK